MFSKDPSPFSPTRGTRLERCRCLAGVKSKEYRFGMCVGGCWPTPTPILVLRTTFWGASYPNPDIRSADKQLLSNPRQPLANLHIPRRSTPTLVSNVLSRPPSQKLIQGRHFNRRSHHSPTSLSLSPFLPLPVDQVEGKRERNRKWWKELRPEDDTRRGERDASSGILWKTCRVTVRKIIRLHICLRGEVIFIELSRSSSFSYRISIVGGCKQYVSIIVITVTSNPSVRRWKEVIYMLLHQGQKKRTRWIAAD